MSPSTAVLLYDTTLRDGSQAEGVSFTVASKLRLAEKLDQFGLDYIEGGWPGSNPRDMAFFKEAKKLNLEHAGISAFGATRRAGMKAEDDPQLQLLLGAETPAAALFGKSWMLHVTDVLRTTPEENLRMIEESVRFLKERGREVIFDAEHFFDGYKADPAYAMRTLGAALDGGADNLTLCDTNGGMLAGELKSIVTAVAERFPDAALGIHCHNDGGLGAALTLAGVEAGAALVQGTMNGFGERVGNANLTTVIPNLILKMGRSARCAQHLDKLRDLSLFVDDMANVRSDLKAPFVGASAFAHKGGVHADAASKVARSYEHIDPERVGNRQRVLVSDMSGRGTIIMKAREMGMDLEEKSAGTKAFLDELKRLEFRGYEFEAADASFKLLLNRWLKKHKEYFKLVSYRVISEHNPGTREMISEATVKLKANGAFYHTVAESQGPVGALDHALRKALETVYPCLREVTLRDYKVRILESSKGTDAEIVVHIESSDGRDFWGTVGAGENIIEASWEALKDSVEYKLLLEEEKKRGGKS